MDYSGAAFKCSVVTAGFEKIAFIEFDRTPQALVIHGKQMIDLVSVAGIAHAGTYGVALFNTVLDDPGTDITTGTGDGNGPICRGYGC